ncbi:MAG: DUF4128 domain-containing protein [Proteobacteria bacterium]|nr:DUF4128 domain-containing protein [Pseudomonadota bacterium]
MSLHLIQTALEKHLIALAPALPTAWPNKTFTPATGTPWQRVDHLTNAPLDMTMERSMHQERGILQISLFYAVNTGRVAAMQRAELTRAHFAPVQYLTEDSVKVEIGDTPRIASAMQDADWLMVPVSVYWGAFIVR